MSEYESLLKRLFASAPTLDFFQAVRLLMHMEPDRQVIGRFTNPGDEVVRFGTHAPVVFPASQRVTDWRRLTSNASNIEKASVLYSLSGSRWP